MSRFPDVRTDEYYNEQYLNKEDVQYIKGYDHAVAEMAHMFYNLDVFPEVQEILDDNKAVIVKGKSNAVYKAIETWMEMHRNELITAMLDEMDQEEYDAIKAEVDGKR